MNNVQVTLTLPEDLVERAKLAGVFADKVIIRVLEEAIDRQEAIDRLFVNLDKLQSDEEPMTPEEIQAEIRAYRAEKRRLKAQE